MALGPFLRNRVGVGNKVFELRIGQLVADDAGGDVAIEQHLRQILRPSAARLTMAGS